MDIGRAIQYWMSDSDWIKKVLIGGVLLFVPIIGWLLLGGYFIRTVQKVSAGSDTPLPEWDQWGDDLVRGLKLFVIYLVYYIPLILIFCVMSVVGAAGDAADFGASILFQCISFLYGLLLAFIAPLFIGRLAANEQIGDAFNFAAIIQDAQRVPTQLIIYAILAQVLGFVASFGVIICVVGIAFTLFIASLINAHLIAQISGMLGLSRPAAPTPPPAM